MSQAQATKELVKRLLDGIQGVSGIGLTWDNKGEPAVLVKVTKGAASDVRRRLSDTHFSVPIIIEEVGIITFEDKTY